ncbi:MAG: hypothetical protein ACTHL8_18215 [Burkholderiaceae bacterium]
MSPDLPTKKDVVDYLRNQQKRAEIDSKVDGVNIWVLYGAIALVVWKIVEPFEPKDWASPLLVARLVVVSMLVGGLLSSGAGLVTRVEEPLFRWPRRGDASRGFGLARYALVAAPLVTLFVLDRSDPAGFVLALAAVVGSALDLFEALSERFTTRRAGFRFPPAVAQPVPASLAAMVFGALIAWHLAATMAPALLAATAGQLKACLLALTLYWLLVTLTRRHARIRQLDWTYALERDLLLGPKSVPAALTEIEYHASGVELPRVFDRYFEQVRDELAGLGARIDAFNQGLAAALAAPAEQTLERQMQHDGLRKLVDEPLLRLAATFRDFHAFQDVGLRERLPRHAPRLDAALAAVREKQAQAEAAVEGVREEVDAALKAVVSGAVHAPPVRLEAPGA